MRIFCRFFALLVPLSPEESAFFPHSTVLNCVLYRVGNLKNDLNLVYLKERAECALKKLSILPMHALGRHSTVSFKLPHFAPGTVLGVVPHVRYLIPYIGKRDVHKFEVPYKLQYLI